MGAPCFMSSPIYICVLTSQNAAWNYQGRIKITRGLYSCFCLRMAFCRNEKLIFSSGKGMGQQFYLLGQVLIVDVDPVYVFHESIKLKLPGCAKSLEDRLEPPTDCSKT